VEFSTSRKGSPKVVEGSSRLNRMHISLLPPSKPPAPGPEQALLETNLAWLRTELEQSELPDRKAALRHEIGVLEELAGRDSVAVRELLAAVNALPRFKEPLERLIGLIERRRSFKNLPTLLEHLCRTVDSSEEECRAQLLSAWCSIAHGRDEARALTAIETALAAAPTDQAALSTLEILSRRLRNGARLRAALEARVATAHTPGWAQCLSLDLADAWLAEGQPERAYAALGLASSDGGDVGLRALERRAALGRAAGRVDWTIEALELLSARILAAPLAASAADSTSTELAAVPSPPLTAPGRAPARALSALLELGRLQAALGHDAAAVHTLERAAKLAPADPVAAFALLGSAEKAGQHALVERLALAEIASVPAGRERAALSVRLAESRLARNEPLLALEALEVALLADPQCWIARAFQLDLLRGTRNAEGYARALEQVAEQAKDAGAQTRYRLLAALDFARHVGDAGAARRALDAATPGTDNPALLARVARTLAFAAQDASWFAEATERLLETESSAPERAGLLLERWRAALLAGDVPEQQRLEAALELLPEGRTASQLARAHARAHAAPAEHAGALDAEALLGLAEQAGDPATRAALEWTAALRLLAADQPGRARELLEKLHREHPAYCVVSGTLAALSERNAATAPELADLLARTGAALEDTEFAASLLIEAGLRRWQAQPTVAAAQHFDQAERRRPGSAQALAHWARRGSERSLGPSDERGVEAAERLLGALERAARADGVNTKQLAELQAALRALGDADTSPLATAARLLVLLLGRSLGMRSDPSLLERLAALHPDASRLVDAWRYLECIAQSEPAPQAFEEVTRKWSESSESLASTLEWLAATQRLAQPAREVRARLRLSEFLPGAAGEQCAASAALVAQISGAAPAPFLSGQSPQLLLTNLETSPPGCDPRRRARALDGVALVLGSDAEPGLALLRGYNLLATGDGPGAIAAFARYAEAFPDDPAGFEGLLAAARHDDDPVQLAEATAALGRTSRDPAHAARLFEEAASIFFDQLHDTAAGEAALCRAVELDIRRKSSFDRLFAWVRESGDAARLLELCQRRLAVQVSADEVRELEWERARAARQLGDTRTAASALDRVLGVDRNHVGALTLLGEIYITTQRYPEAADVLARLSSLEGASPEQRLQSGLYAVDLFENQLDDTPRALEVLLGLHRAGLSTLPVRERLARAAAKSESWDDAVIVLEQLMFERSTPEERAEAARLALAIHRDRRHDVRSAGHATEALLTHLPHDAEALDLALGGELDPALTDRLLRQGEQALAQRLRQDPFQLEALRRLARIADRTGSLALRQVSLGALVALGHGPSSGARAELAALDQRICTTPSVAWTPELLAELADPEDQGPIAQLLALVAPHLTRALGPDLKTFQVTRRERIVPSSGLPIRNEVAAWVGALGLGDFELYQSGVAADRIVALATEPLSVILGSRVTAPLGPFQRQELVRALYALSRQRGVLTQLDELEVAALVVALCSLGGVSLPAPNYARQGDFERQLSRVLPRKLRKVLPDYALGVQQNELDVARWVRTALASLDRAATIVVGDISLVLSDSPAAERSGSAPAPPTERTRRLASFVLAPEFEALRRRAGVTLA